MSGFEYDSNPWPLWYWCTALLTELSTDLESRDGVVVKALASYQCGPGSIESQTWRHVWVEFVVGSRPFSERFFSGYSGFPLSSKTNIFKYFITI